MTDEGEDLDLSALAPQTGPKRDFGSKPLRGASLPSRLASGPSRPKAVPRLPELAALKRPLPHSISTPVAIPLGIRDHSGA
jgi:hypothetical protein